MSKWLSVLALWCAAQWSVAAADDPRAGFYHAVLKDGREAHLKIGLDKTNISVQVRVERELYLGSLSGPIAKGKPFRLKQERAQDLRWQTLGLEGDWDSSRAMRGTIFIGETTNSLSFVAEQIAVMRSLERKSGFKLFGRGGRAKATAKWPEFTGTNSLRRAVSSLLAAEAQTNISKIAAEGPSLTVEGLRDGSIESKHEAFFSTDVAWLSADWVSLIGVVWEDTGGAHGNGVPVSRNFIWPQGQLKEVNLADLFLPGDAWIRQLSKFGLKALHAQGAPWVTNSELKYASLKELTTNELGAWTVNRLGLNIYLGPYVAGPYSDGDWEIFLPWADLRAILDPAGPAQLIPGALKDTTISKP